MIPKLLPALHELGVLVTRPEAQAGALCAQIERLGGRAVALPAIAIEPIQADAPAAASLVVFTSVNAVTHGAHLVIRHQGMKVAAIGRATAEALAQAQLPVDIVPEAGYTSEALLSHPALAELSGASVLIVHGEGGRDVLQQSFAERGNVVTTCEVYRRLLPTVDPQRIAEVEQLWSDSGIDVVTLTSVETLQNLMRLLSEHGNELLKSTAYVVPSVRVLEAARAAGLKGDCLLSAAAEDLAMLNAIARWHARARN